MSINHCWVGLNIMREKDEKEAMFEKPLTPSDVGKLNRLVIPKQHAEKHFPLDSDTGKGLLLSFEDESGKCWRFRYSYWNSSQSYVLTKGWSRYVKDNSLRAGDVVFFLRHRTHPQRFFLTSTRRQPPPGGGCQGQGHNQTTTPVGKSSSGRVLRLFGVNMECQPHQNSTPQSSSYPLSSTHLYQPSYSSSNPHPHPHPHMLPQPP